MPWSPDELYSQPKKTLTPAAPDTIPAGGVSPEALYRLRNPRDLAGMPTDPTTGMSAIDLARAGAGKFLVDTGRGFRQLGVDAIANTPTDPFGFKPLSLQLQEEEDLRKKQDQPLMATGPGLAGYIGGGVATQVAGALAAPSYVTAPKTILQGVLSGAAQGSFLPRGTSDSLGQNVLLGGTYGGIGNAVGQIPGRLIQPLRDVSPEAKTLLSEGVVPTPGQAVDRSTWGGKILAGTEEKAQSIPLLGDVISNARQRAVEDLNAAAVKRTGGSGIGNDAIDAAHRNLNQTFTQLAAGQKVKLDNTFQLDLTDLTLTQDAQRIVQKKLDNVFNAAQNGVLSGEAYSKFRSQLATLGNRYANAGSPSDYDLGVALTRMSDALDNAFQAQAPKATQEAWATARDQWANLKRVEAAAKQATGGVFTPGQLKQAVTNQASTAQAAGGNAKMQDLSNAGMALASKTPNSGTADRGALIGLLSSIGAGSASYATNTLPELGAATGLAGLAYGSKPITKYLVGGFPLQGILSGPAYQYVPPAATQVGRLYLQNQ